jgi:predicted MFS family arabinose efflux permease
MIDNFTWREAFVVPGLLSIAGGVVLAWYRHCGRIVDVKYDRAPTAPPSAQAIKRAFFVLTLTMACNGFVYTGLTNTMPKIFETGLGENMAGSYTEIGLYVGAVIGFASLSSIAGGWLADRFSPRLIYIVLWGLLIAPLALITSTFGGSLIAMMALIMTVNTGFAAAENMLVARYTPFEWRAIAYGAKFVLALGVGGLTVQLAGNLYDSSGSFDVLYLLFGGAAIMATMAALLLPGEQSARQTPA